MLLLMLVALLWSGMAMAQGTPDPYGGDTEYRTMFAEDSPMGWLTPRIIIWVLAQLHLLFAAFVLAVPMFVVVIQLTGLLSKDEAKAKQYDGLAYEFTKLLTTAFSITSILGAIFTFCLIGLYPKLFGYMAEVFGPTMYLYSILFFGESFSLYFYYYGWGKFRSRWAHLGIGVMLNVFGVTLMLVANAWTTFMMAPGGVSETGAVVDRSAAFFNYLLHPINIHRLIANLCFGGSIAAAYAAYKWLTTTDPVKRAHYDWMGYIGNFIAILFLLPLPFAGYYLGFEIYAFNQQLGIYMMGGVLSWLFVLQAVLVGALFFAANYYLWLGMDRIPGSERYRGWIKFLLGVVTVCVLVWATPKSLILTSAEIDAMGGTSHPILSLLGVMSAKNTAVNILILTTFLSFLLYRRGNKIPVVSWAKTGSMVQGAVFAVAAAVVIFIGVGGYMPDLWLESTKRVAMSPYQVIAVLVCMGIVMPIDIMMLRGAKEVGAIQWGKVSRRSQYTLIFLAVSFTWLMALMGFVRSSLRQHWHVYEVLKDTSPEAYTPSVGYATIIVTVVVILFFALVSLVIGISSLGSKEKLDRSTIVPPTLFERIGKAAIGVAIVVLCIVGYQTLTTTPKRPSEGAVALAERKASEQAALGAYGTIDADKGHYKVPIERAMEMVVARPASLEPAIVIKADLDEMSPMERGEHLFHKSVHACGACHSVDGSKKQAPTLLGRFGKPTELSDGTTSAFDRAYVVESLNLPKVKLTKGYDPSKVAGAVEMPSFAGKISDQELTDLIAYLQSL
jgi:cytochrome bd-type quinol oxidase subunit 1/mono/diheme cytochrome c family protein